MNGYHTLNVETPIRVQCFYSEIVLMHFNVFSYQISHWKFNGIEYRPTVKEGERSVIMGREGGYGTHILSVS